MHSDLLCLHFFTAKFSKKKCLYYYLTIVLLLYRHNSNYSRITAKIVCVTRPLYKNNMIGLLG